MSKKRFFIYNSWQPTIELLTTEEKAEMLMNFFRFQNNQQLVLNTSGLKMAWVSFQFLLDKDSTNYETKRTTMAANRAKRSNVSTSTLDVNTNVSTSDLNVNTTSSTNALSDNVNVNAKVNDNDNVKVNVNVNDNVDVNEVKRWILSNNCPTTSSIQHQFPHLSKSECSKLIDEVINDSFNF